jgi:hypothetical protein
MNKDEIKKALWLCSKDGDCFKCPYEDCCKCPYFDNNYCTITLQKDALTLITEQEKEIERLKAENERFESNMKVVLEIEKKQAQIDVLNELKARHDYATKNMGYPWDISQQIDELIKEVAK